MFKKAIRLKLRFITSRGKLSVEDLWDLGLQDLNQLAKSYNRTIKRDNEEDFLGETNPEEDLTKLRFDIVLSILDTKKKEAVVQEQATENKHRRDKIMEIMAEKQDDTLRDSSMGELEKKLQKLGG